MASEFEKIERFVGMFSAPPPPLGPGDDACILPLKAGRLCMTTDALVEGVHFSRKHFSLGEVGHKALAVNLSDLAAMGAAPDFWLCALGLPSRFGGRQLEALARGMLPLAKRHRLKLLGGNLTASPLLSLTLSLGGWAQKPLLRSGAKAGDKLYVLGSLGEASAGLWAMQRGLRVPARFLEAQRRPTPWVEAAQALSPHIHAAIDVSDGLLQDLGHMCTASGLGVKLEASALPISEALWRRFPKRALSFALRGGEDYALLLAVSPQKAKRVEREWTPRTCPLSCVGSFIDLPGIWLDGRRVSARGFQHG
ncbi:MAG: thiamine-phosphate kinase [Proteobacteria bacterium]|nr:thiamine-phosphate kinase [Cystobacterineae bacterium]MCL2313814.1 thiamine-phosphate kinase [Pseudomonadota bacterium]